MVDMENRGDWKRERSLLTLGLVTSGEDEAIPVAIEGQTNQSWRDDAASRHRLARSQREAQANPVPPTLDASEWRQPDEAPAEPSEVWRPQEEAGIGDLPPEAPAAKATAQGPGLIRTFLAKLFRKPSVDGSADESSSEFASPMLVASANPPQIPPYPDDAESDAVFPPRQPAIGYPPPVFPQGAYVGQSPSRYPLMPRQAPYLSSSPYAQPTPYAQPAGYPEPWPAPPQAGYPYSQALAPHAGQMPSPPQPASVYPPRLVQSRPAADRLWLLTEVDQAAEGVERQTSIEEIRTSLREFREAVLELTESRARRRYF